MSGLPDGPLVAWYGDDFTGAAAVMETLTFAGLPSVLFLDTPDAARLARFAKARGIGIAGTARSRSPAWMAAHLPRVLRALAAIPAPVRHYKVCSTFDSAPHVGSIGTAIDLALPIFEGWVPLMPAAPGIRRWQAFGTLFAGGPDGIARLDRHPAMARHPVTPMDEADVRRHLAGQTDAPVGLVDLLDLATPERARAALARELAAGARVVALDALDEARLGVAGGLIWGSGAGAFAVGSQGVEEALVAHWRAEGCLSATSAFPAAKPAARVAVVSGSVSPVTALQIEAALAAGFAAIRLDAAACARGGEAADGAVEAATRDALCAAAGGRDPIVLTALGPDDPAVRARPPSGSEEAAGVAAERIGAALSAVLRALIRQGGIRRVAVAGGDSSGQVVSTLGIDALTALVPVAPGVALLRGHSDAPALDGIEIALKGGQMGSADIFARIRAGGGRM